ncbi:hypothetical protein JCM10450v2_004719 [Rhodotorula kratochvilovae]
MSFAKATELSLNLTTLLAKNIDTISRTSESLERADLVVRVPAGSALAEPLELHSGWLYMLSSAVDLLACTSTEMEMDRCLRLYLVTGCFQLTDYSARRVTVQLTIVGSFDCVFPAALMLRVLIEAIFAKDAGNVRQATTTAAAIVPQLHARYQVQLGGPNCDEEHAAAEVARRSLYRNNIKDVARAAG